MFARVAPAGRHYQIEEFVDDAGRMENIFCQMIYLTEINVPEVGRIYFSGDAVFNLNVRVFRLIRFENAIPDV